MFLPLQSHQLPLDNSIMNGSIGKLAMDIAKDIDLSQIDLSNPMQMLQGIMSGNVNDNSGLQSLFGNITKDAVEKIDKIQSTIDFRNKQLEAAIENNPDKVEVYKRAIKSLEEAMKEYVLDVQQIEASAIWITIFGFGVLILVKLIQGVLANTIFEKRYSEWLSNKLISPGMKMKNYILSGIFTAVIMLFSVVHLVFLV